MFSYVLFKKNHRKAQASISEKDLTLDKLKAELQSMQDQMTQADIDAKNQVILEKGMFLVLKIY